MKPISKKNGKGYRRDESYSIVEAIIEQNKLKPTSRHAICVWLNRHNMSPDAWGFASYIAHILKKVKVKNKNFKPSEKITERGDL